MGLLQLELPLNLNTWAAAEMLVLRSGPRSRPREAGAGHHEPHDGARERTQQHASERDPQVILGILIHFHDALPPRRTCLPFLGDPRVTIVKI
jgi:hypothetical protein